jgi:hypothetical protein
MHASDHGPVCGDASMVQHMVVLEHVALRAVLQHDVRRSHTPYSMLSASARRASGLVPFCSKRNLLCGTAVARAYTSPRCRVACRHGCARCFGSTAVSSQPGCPLLRHVVPWQQRTTGLSACCCCMLPALVGAGMARRARSFRRARRARGALVCCATAASIRREKPSSRIEAELIGGRG